MPGELEKSQVLVGLPAEKRSWANTLLNVAARYGVLVSRKSTYQSLRDSLDNPKFGLLVLEPNLMDMELSYMDRFREVLQLAYCAEQEMRIPVVVIAESLQRVIAGKNTPEEVETHIGHVIPPHKFTEIQAVALITNLVRPN